MKETTSAAEIYAAKNHSEAALAAIISRQMPIIRMYARRSVRPGLDFDDAVQEGIIGLFFAIQHFDEQRDVSFQTYASVCIRNSILTAQKAAGRKKHSPLNQRVPISESQSIPGPEEQAIASEQVALTLEKARTKLSALEKTVLQLTLDGFTPSQIAVKISKPVKSVENALSRLRSKLRSH